MNEFKLIIWWPLRLMPEEIDLMMKSEIVQALLAKNALRARMYENNKYDDIIRRTIVDVASPFLYITNIEKENTCYVATCKIPDVPTYENIFKILKDPVLYPVLLKSTKDGLMDTNDKFVLCHFKIVEYEKIDKLGSSYAGVNYPYPERWTYPENNYLTYIDGPEKSLAQSLQEEYDERRKKLIDKIKNGTEFNNISEE